MMAETSIELLKSLTQADGIPGFEAEVRKIFRDKLSDTGAIGTDRLGSIFCTRVGSAEHPRILLDSHMDEVGFIVQSVTDSGYIKFLPVGGWWAHTLLAQRVTITTKLGKVPGIIGSTPPHLLGSGSRDKVVDMKDLFIDVGAESQEQAMEEFGVLPGCPIAPYGPFMPLKNSKLFSAKAFDNRVGVAIVIEALLGLENHPNTVISAGSVQEEVGLRGAKTVTASVQPDIAIVLEGPPADDTPGLGGSVSQGKLGGGVQIRLYDPSMIVNPKLGEFVIETAKQHQIPYQIAVRQSGGTDGGSIHQVSAGVPSIVLGVPARYVHSHVSIINIDDYTATLELVSHLVREIDASVLEGFLFD
jgi:endoglucanase